MRKRFLVKPFIQIRHLIWTLSVVIVCFLASYAVFESMVSSAVLNGSLNINGWLELRNQLRWGFVISLIILLFSIGLENYLFFHSVVGPIYALERGLKRLMEGHFNDVTHIRESDQFSEVIQAFEEMKKQILMKIDMQEKTALLLASELDRLLVNTSAENINNLKSRLKEIREQVEKKAA